MAGKRLNGIDTNISSWDQQSDTHKSLGLHRDLRPFKTRHPFFYKFKLQIFIAIAMAIMSIVNITFSEIYMILSCIFVTVATGRYRTFKDKTKVQWDRPKYLDYNLEISDLDFQPKETHKDLVPYIKKVMGMKASENPGKAIYFIGHELDTETEVHADDDRIRTHIIIFGTTGSGKTETILSFCVNFLIQASGFLLVDGKGDSLLYAKVLGLVVAFNRTEDLYLLNFMDPGNVVGRMVQKISNTFNFLVECTALQCNEIMGGLLPSEDGGGMWESRATAGISALNSALYYQFEKGFIELDPEIYQSYFDLTTFAKLSQDTTVPKSYRSQMRTLLTSVNYKLPTASEPNPKQPNTTEEQWQYIVMQYTGTFSMLAGDYKHITVAQYPEISIEDVVLRRRILLVLLPSLAKSPNNVKNLGRIIISLTRNVASKAIGSRVEGLKADVIDSKPTSAINSFALVFDEYGIYATSGAEQLPAQVRSLNLVCLFAGQDYQAFKKGDENAAASIFANCTQKACMKLAEPTETFELFNKSAGEQYVMRADSYDIDSTIFGRKYKPKEEARVEKAPILDMRDLQSQPAGVATWVRGGEVTRIKHFYANPVQPPRFRLLHMIQIRAPKTPVVIQSQKALDALYKKILMHLQPDFEQKSTTPSFMLSKIMYVQFHQMMQMRKKLLDEMAKNPPEKMPTETELMSFIISVTSRHISFTDRKIEQVVEEQLGLSTDTNFDEQSDDSSVMSMIDEHESDRTTIPIKSSNVLLQTFAPGEWDSTQLLDDARSNNTSQVHADVDVIKKNKETSPSVPVKSDSETSSASSVLSSDKIQEVLHRIKQRSIKIQNKEQRTSGYNPFHVMKLDAFSVQQGIMSLEQAIMQQHGMPASLASEIAKSNAAYVVADIERKTDISYISERKRLKTSPPTSSRQTRDRINQLIKSAETSPNE